MRPKDRIRIIKDAVATVQADGGRDSVTVSAVARACALPTSESLVKKYFPGGREALLD